MAVPAFEIPQVNIVAIERPRTQSLLARFFWPEPRPLRLVQHTLSNKWRLRGSLRISPEEHGLYELFFSDPSDSVKVLAQRPLSFANHLIGAVPWEPPTEDTFLNLRFMNFWICLYKLPKQFRTPPIGEGLVSILGDVIGSGIFDREGSDDYFVRCLVRLDTEKPFLGRRELKIGSNKPIWVKFQYEGLPQVCFQCGYAGHPVESCPERSTQPPNLKDRNSWMTNPVPFSWRRLHPVTLQPIRGNSRQADHGMDDRVSPSHLNTSTISIQVAISTVLIGELIISNTNLALSYLFKAIHT
ncbi:hypothetical protein LINGRAPRIM_LOCUS173 [Linum grandiflorum]